jgi:hypothetical protein
MLVFLNSKPFENVEVHPWGILLKGVKSGTYDVEVMCQPASWPLNNGPVIRTQISGNQVFWSPIEVAKTFDPVVVNNEAWDLKREGSVFCYTRALFGGLLAVSIDSRDTAARGIWTYGNLLLKRNQSAGRTREGLLKEMKRVFFEEISSTMQAIHRHKDYVGSTASVTGRVQCSKSSNHGAYDPALGCAWC